ncbi:hypothetical protein ARMSODRAFT_1028498 [Armillaria solidipes]|uniref:Uncharacterized protein n=1 Tax=Armillaria solidipes TaxID=1076256 RepID=A0A2H3B0K5_9AGAR|nr:hypothetical protein ARMSODRAFT_1028498 [Armillaria solidipes]
MSCSISYQFTLTFHLLTHSNNFLLNVPISFPNNYIPQSTPDSCIVFLKSNAPQFLSTQLAPTNIETLLQHEPELHRLLLPQVYPKSSPTPFTSPFFPSQVLPRQPPLPPSPITPSHYPSPSLQRHHSHPIHTPHFTPRLQYLHFQTTNHHRPQIPTPKSHHQPNYPYHQPPLHPQPHFTIHRIQHKPLTKPTPMVHPFLFPLSCPLLPSDYPHS